MIENISSLKPKDKLYMIYNKTSFSLPTISTINFKEQDWIEEVKIHVSPTDIEFTKDHSINLYNMNILKNELGDNQIGENDKKLLLDKIINIVKSPTETKENIFDMFISYSQLLTYSNILLNNGTVQRWGDTIEKFTRHFMYVLLPWKLTAHEIYVYSKTDSMPDDKDLQSYCLQTVRNIITEIKLDQSSNKKPSLEKMGVLIYQLCSYLDSSHKSNTLKQSITNIICVLHNYDKDALITIVNKLFNEDVNALNIIDMIEDKNDNMSSIIINSAKRMIEENYKNNKISTKINNGGLCIGDDVFTNNIDVKTLLTEIDKISGDRLKDYIGENKVTSFDIIPNKIGYLRLKKELQICKIMTRDDGFYSLTKYDNKTYLLFNIIGDNNCYGISLQCEFGGSRSIVVFDISTDYDYIMTM